MERRVTADRRLRVTVRNAFPQSDIAVGVGGPSGGITRSFYELVVDHALGFGHAVFHRKQEPVTTVRPFPPWRTNAHPGRPVPASLIHCVSASSPGPQGTGPTCGPLSSAGLDRPGDLVAQIPIPTASHRNAVTRLPP